MEKEKKPCSKQNKMAVILRAFISFSFSFTILLDIAFALQPNLLNGAALDFASLISLQGKKQGYFLEPMRKLEIH